jgi:hypothetical protein
MNQGKNAPQSIQPVFAPNGQGVSLTLVYKQASSETGAKLS